MLTKQRLAGPGPGPATARGLVSLTKELGYVQLDPVSIVAPAHAITFWSRFGEFRPAELDRALWKQRTLFEHWSFAASLVPVSDYALHYSLMRRYPESLSKSWGHWRAYARRWLPAHAQLRRSVLRQLADGPKLARDFREHARTKRPKQVWSSGSDVTEMLTHLQLKGEVMVVGHQGIQKVWGLPRKFLPPDTDRRVLPQATVEYEGAQRGIQALGLALPREIMRGMMRGRFFELDRTLDRLQADERIFPVHVDGTDPRAIRYVHADDRDRLESFESGDWGPRLSLLSPFDNVLANRGAVKELFDFEYAHENYTPAARRKYGTYVMPILAGDRFLGRIDPRLDRERGVLRVNSVHAEAGIPGGADRGREVADLIERFGAFLGASEVEYTARVPSEWSRALR